MWDQRRQLVGAPRFLFCGARHALGLGKADAVKPQMPSSSKRLAAGVGLTAPYVQATKPTSSSLSNARNAPLRSPISLTNSSIGNPCGLVDASTAASTALSTRSPAAAADDPIRVDYGRQRSALSASRQATPNRSPLMRLHGEALVEQRVPQSDVQRGASAGLAALRPQARRRSPPVHAPPNG